VKIAKMGSDVDALQLFAVNIVKKKWIYVKWNLALMENVEWMKTHFWGLFVIVKPIIKVNFVSSQ